MVKRTPEQIRMKKCYDFGYAQGLAGYEVAHLKSKAPPNLWRFVEIGHKAGMRRHNNQDGFVLLRAGQYADELGALIEMGGPDEF